MFLPGVKNIFASRTQILRPKHMFPSLPNPVAQVRIFKCMTFSLPGSVIIFLELPADAWDAAECMKRIVKARAKRAKLLFSFLIKQIR